ncbi:hypothetical protein ILUMI_15432, partial [Ignelater luminosus]
ALSEDGVVEAKRMITKRNGVFVNTASVLLTFNRIKLPGRVKVSFYSLEVRPYIPAPLRCYRCQSFGHIANCKRNPICNCGKPVHENSECEEPFVCVNCDGNHSSLSPKCPVYRLEKEIKTIQTLQKIPYAEARKQVVPKGMLSYSQVAAKPSQTSNIVPAVQAFSTSNHCRRGKRNKVSSTTSVLRTKNDPKSKPTQYQSRY